MMEENQIEIAVHEALKKLGIEHTWPLEPVITRYGKHIVFAWNVEEYDD